MSNSSDPEKSSADGGSSVPVLSNETMAPVALDNLKDMDEAATFFRDHPRATEIAEEGAAILEDPVLLKKLIRKIDMNIAPLLAAVYVCNLLR